MNIRVASKTDWLMVNSIAKQVHDLHVNLRPDIYAPQNEVITESGFQHLLDNRIVLVGEQDDKVIAYACCIVKEIDNPIKCQMKIMFVEAIGVDENNKNCGVGKEMMDWIMDYGRQRKCHRIELQVSAKNEKTIGFYEHLGMKEKMKTMEKDL